MLLSTIKYFDDPSKKDWPTICQRPAVNTAELKSTIDEIYSKIKSDKDTGLKELTLKFDNVSLDELSVSVKEMTDGINQVPNSLKSAIDVAYSNITKFHNSQKLSFKKIETSDEVYCWQETRAIQKVGLYIPGGSAPLFSTVLMLGVPAQIAGCQEVVLCTPPNKEGKIHPAMLYAAKRCGIQTIIKVGGAQAIAAMALGTETVPNVLKVFGPGNQYVTAAKLKAVELGLSIDLPAGPSEVLVYADKTSDIKAVVADLLSQAEHGPDSQVVLVSDGSIDKESIEQEIKKQLQKLPRANIAMQALSHSAMVSFGNKERAFRFINEYSPEHLILTNETAESCIKLVQNAGSVFVGPFTPESAGDYASGTNHTLPTAGYAKTYSGVSLDSFIKKITFQSISKKGLENLGPSIIEMAEAEELQAHANAVKIRLQ